MTVLLNPADINPIQDLWDVFIMITQQICSNCDAVNVDMEQNLGEII